MQGIGADIVEIYDRFKGAKALAQQQGLEDQKRSRMMEIGQIAGKGDYSGAASKALAYGDLPTGSSLLQLAQGQKKFDAEDRQQVAGALYAADTPEKWAATLDFLEKSGHTIDDNERDFNNRDAIIGQALGPDGQLKQRNDDREFNANEAYRGANLDIERQKLAGGGAKPPSGYRVSADGQGLEPIPGGPADPNKQVPVKSLRPTTDQNNAAGFYDRMTEAEKVLSDPESVAAAIDYVGKKKAELPLGVGNYLATPEYQKFDQSVRDFVNAQLRKESGAAISEGEFESARKQYFPQPGDSADVIKQKARNRATAINAMKRTAAGALTQGGQQQGAAEMPTGDAEAAFADAQDAISQGADPQAVLQELIGMGIDPQMAEQALQQ